LGNVARVVGAVGVDGHGLGHFCDVCGLFYWIPGCAQGLVSRRFAVTPSRASSLPHLIFSDYKYPVRQQSNVRVSLLAIGYGAVTFSVVYIKSCTVCWRGCPVHGHCRELQPLFARRYLALKDRFVTGSSRMARILRSNSYTNHASSRVQCGCCINSGGCFEEPRDDRASAQRLQPPPV
jgi:hypothetical protein